MPIELKFEKSEAERFIQSLDEGKSIDVPKGGWTVDSVLTLAGVCQEVARSQTRQNEEAPMPEELLAAIEWCASVARFVADGQYEDSFEPSHQTLIFIDPQGKKKFRQIDGFKWQGQTNA